jgi:ribosomal protein L37AE/L43A
MAHSSQRQVYPLDAAAAAARILMDAICPRCGQQSAFTEDKRRQVWQCEACWCLFPLSALAPIAPDEELTRWMRVLAMGGPDPLLEEVKALPECDKNADFVRRKFKVGVIRANRLIAEAAK